MSSPALKPFGAPTSAYAWTLRPSSLFGTVSVERFIHCGSAARSTVCATPLGPVAPGWLSKTLALLANAVSEWRASTLPVAASIATS